MLRIFKIFFKLFHKTLKKKERFHMILKDKDYGEIVKEYDFDHIIVEDVGLDEYHGGPFYCWNLYNKKGEIVGSAGSCNGIMEKSITLNEGF